MIKPFFKTEVGQKSPNTAEESNGRWKLDRILNNSWQVLVAASKSTANVNIFWF